MVKQLDPPRVHEQRLKMTYDEWLAWESEDRHGEWVDGAVIVFMPPTLVHQDYCLWLGSLFAWYVRRFDLGRVVVAPFEMQLRPGHASREPDLMFVARDNLKRLTTERLAGSADLVVEIISEWSVTHDTKIKRAEYEAAAIPEYWLLDARPRHSRARFLQLDPDGHYQESPPDGAGRYYSVASPGFWLDVGWLWQHPWPDPDELKPLMLAHRDAMRGEKSE